MVGLVVVSHSENLAKSVVELFEGQKVEMVDCPVVEGAVVATIDAVGGMSFEAIKEDLAKVGTTPKF